MERRKNLLIVLGEWWETRRSDPSVMCSHPGRLSRLLRWLTPNGGTLILLALFVFAQSVGALPLASRQSAPGLSATTVNYQGRLADNAGVPLDGTYGMSFALYDAATEGNLIWGPESHTAVPVSGGLFSVGLGSKTSGGIPTTVWDGDRYLEITVGGETLSPRELIRSVPIAGMALTVPDGAVESNNLDLDSGTACLSGHATVDLPGNWQTLDVPGLSLSFSLEKPSQVLVWVDGLASFSQSTSGEAAVGLAVDSVEEAVSFTHDVDDAWFNVKGQRLLDLGSGSHSIGITAHAFHQGTMTVHGASSGRTCVNYLVLGEQ